MPMLIPIISLVYSKENMLMRTKECSICETSFTTLYRIQYRQPKAWVFACESCLKQVKENNPFYRYGGTWKK